MKTKSIVLLLIVALLAGSQVLAQEKKKSKEWVTFLVSMSCGNCQKKIEKNIAFEKGVSDLIVNLEDKTVTIEYQVKKTNPDKLKAAIEDLGFEVEFYTEKETEKTE